VKGGNSTIVSVDDAQMQAVAATLNNDITIEDNNRAVVNVEGTPQVNGLLAITASAGIGNLINHSVRVNVKTNP
jgi:hypothetical protein